jgi:Tol biopolymer transport system component
MELEKNKKWVILVAVLMLTSTFAFFTFVDAKKPPKPDDDDSKPTGTIYYWTLDENDDQYVYSMNGDGSSKTKLNPHLEGMYSLSHSKHGDNWWFTGFKSVEGTYPDGQQKQMIVAIRDDGSKSSELILDSSLSIDRYSSNPVWNKGDSLISWSALKWTTDGSGDPIVSSAGLFKASVYFDSNGDVSGFGTITLVKSCGTWVGPNNILRPDIRERHSWSQDGKKVAYQKMNSGDTDKNVYIYDTVSAIETELVTGGSSIDWSMDGNYVTYRKAGSVYIIKPDGTGNTFIVQEKQNGPSNTIIYPTFSGDSKYLVYQHRFYKANTIGATYQLYIIGIDGSGKSCVTNNLDADDYKYAIAWR